MISKTKKVPQIVLCLALIVLVFTSGCAELDFDYAVSDEQYAMGWIIHNVNDSTSTELSFDESDVAIYNHSFNYPAENPELFEDVFFWAPPIQANATDYRYTQPMSIVVPLNRTYYVMGTNPPSEYYKSNWSLLHYVYLNYLTSEHYYDQYLLEKAHKEYSGPENGYNSINPIAGEKKQMAFGTAPYSAADIIVESNSMRLSKYLVTDRFGESHLWRDMYYLNESYAPLAKVLTNGTLTSNITLVNFSNLWDASLFNQTIEPDTSYLAEISIKTGYPIWSEINTSALIANSSNQDIQPPNISGVSATPYFEYSKPYYVRVNITDNQGIKNASIYFKPSNATEWIYSEQENTSEVYDATIIMDIQNGTSIDLLISAEDSKGNQENKTIANIATFGRTVNVSIGSYDTVFKGGTLTVAGNITDGSGRLLKYIREDFFINGTYVNYSATDYYGEFAFEWGMPCSYADSDLNASVVFDGTGIYLNASETKQIYLTDLGDFDINSTANISDRVYLNAISSGATVIINRTDKNWSYSMPMNGNSYYFYPRNYGNYTVTLNTSCASISKNIFVNVTTVPQIVDIYVTSFPLNNDTVKFEARAVSVADHNVSFNISNSTMNQKIDAVYDGYNEEDYQTGEPYKYYYYNYWNGNISGLGTGVYNITAEITDDAGQKNNRTEEFFVYSLMNVTFNLADKNGTFIRRTVSVALGQSANILYSTYDINGTGEITIPNTSISSAPTHIWLTQNLNYSGYRPYYYEPFKTKVAFVNTSPETLMDIMDEYYNITEGMADIILYKKYAYRTSWNYSATKIYVNIPDPWVRMHDFSKMTIYTCENWDFTTNACRGSWNLARNVYKSIYTHWWGDDDIIISADAGKTEAYAIGESRYCGDGTCSAYESCSTCTMDCGSCSVSEAPKNDSNQVNIITSNIQKKILQNPKTASLASNAALLSIIRNALGKSEMDQDQINKFVQTSNAFSAEKSISRTITVRNTSSTVETKIKYNGTASAKNYILYDKVPKSFANNSNYIDVRASGARVEVVQADPEYAIIYDVINPGQEMTISYDVGEAVSVDIVDSFAAEVYAESMDAVQSQTSSSCPNILTPAKNIETNECMEFSTPCSVPMGWSVVSSCEENIAETASTEFNEKPGVNESKDDTEKKTDYIKYVIVIPIILIILFAIVKAYEQYSKNKTKEKNIAGLFPDQKYTAPTTQSTYQNNRPITETKSLSVNAPVPKAANKNASSFSTDTFQNNCLNVAENKIGTPLQATVNSGQDDSQKYRMWFEKSRMFLSKSKRIGSILDGERANEHAQYLKVAEECIESAEANLKNGQLKLMEQDMKDAEGLMDAIYDIQRKI